MPKCHIFSAHWSYAPAHVRTPSTPFHCTSHTLQYEFNDPLFREIHILISNVKDHERFGFIVKVRKRTTIQSSLRTVWIIRFTMATASNHKRKQILWSGLPKFWLKQRRHKVLLHVCASISNRLLNWLAGLEYYYYCIYTVRVTLCHAMR